MADPADNLDPIDPPPSDPPPSDPPADPPPSDPPANAEYFSKLPDDWRAQIAGEDAGRAKHLERVLDMNVFTDNYFNMQKKITAGELSSGLPEDATPEQLADWRIANGVPEAAAGYDVKLDDGVSMDDYTMNTIAAAYESAHKHNVSADAMSAIASDIVKAQTIAAEAAIADDNIHKQTSVAALKETWGADYKMNTNMVAGLIAQLPGEIKETFESARLADGRGVFNSPEMMVFFADIARKLDPAGTVVPNANNPTQAVTDEIAKLEKQMVDDPNWHKDKASNNRLIELYEVDERLKRGDQ